MASDEPIFFAPRNLWKSRDGLFKDVVFQVKVFGVKEAGNWKKGTDNVRMKPPKRFQSIFLKTRFNLECVKSVP